MVVVQEVEVTGDLAMALQEVVGAVLTDNR